MAKTLSYINTTPHVPSKQNEATPPWKTYQPHGGSSGISMSEVLKELLPVIGENYSDVVSLLMTENYLHNPAFANNAEGWIMPDKEKAYIAVSDGKNRLFLLDGGSIIQENAVIRKPGKYEIYEFTEEEEVPPGQEPPPEGENPPEEEEAPDDSFEPSSELVLDQVSWEAMEIPEKTESKEEKQNVLYLSLSYICKSSGTISVGFFQSDQTSEDALKVRHVLARPSEEIQTITTQGTWDGVGDFEISLTGGQVEIVGLSLLDKSFEDYCKQTYSHIMQSVENINKELDFLEQIVRRFTLVQSHVNQLYSNDAALKSFLDKQATLIEELQESYRVIGKALEGIHSALSSHDSRITSNKDSISGILNTLSELEEWKTSIGTDISGINTAIANLDKRISALEKSGST